VKAWELITVSICRTDELLRHALADAVDLLQFRGGLPPDGRSAAGLRHRALALKLKRALREQVGECLTCSIGIAPNVFLG
jgi:hypothetical protein